MTEKITRTFYTLYGSDVLSFLSLVNSLLVETSCENSQTRSFNSNNHKQCRPTASSRVQISPGFSIGDSLCRLKLGNCRVIIENTWPDWIPFHQAFIGLLPARFSTMPSSPFAPSDASPFEKGFVQNVDISAMVRPYTFSDEEPQGENSIRCDF